jgi:hypothetical protein
MEDLQQRLKALEHKHSGPRRCSLGRIMADMEQDVIEVLERLLSNPLVSTRSIYLELTSDGYKIERSTITHHRNGRCVCTHKETE